MLNWEEDVTGQGGGQLLQEVAVWMWLSSLRTITCLRNNILKDVIWSAFQILCCII